MKKWICEMHSYLELITLLLIYFFKRVAEGNLLTQCIFQTKKSIIKKYLELFCIFITIFRVTVKRGKGYPWYITSSSTEFFVDFWNIKQNTLYISSTDSETRNSWFFSMTPSSKSKFQLTEIDVSCSTLIL